MTSGVSIEYNELQRHDSLDSVLQKNAVDYLRQVILKDNSLSM